MNRLFSIIFALLLAMSTGVVFAQNEDVKTPFEYPVAPDTCSNLESRCNFIVVNFWNNYNISKPIADDRAFEKAFRDYITFFKYAHPNIVKSSIRDFIFKARANSANLLKIVAELTLYGPYAEYWSDEIYTVFAQTLSESTHLKTDVRNYFKRQVKMMSTNVIDQPIPDFDIVTAEGKNKLSSIEAETYLIFFSDGSSDSSFERTRLSIDLGVNALLETGKAKIVQVYVGKPASDWMQNQPENWINSYSEQALNTVDLRFFPCCYILDKDRKIIMKNVTVEEVKSALN